MQLDDDHSTICDEPTNQPSTTTQRAATDQETKRLGERYTVQDAAEVLGTTVDAVRGRVRRGTLDSMKVNGVVYVLLDEASRNRHADQLSTQPDETSRLDEANRGQSEFLEELRDQVDWLRREVERKDTIIMSLAQRVPELEPAREAPGARQRATTPAPGGVVRGRGQAPGGSQESQEAPGKRRSWLYRFFFGP